MKYKKPSPLMSSIASTLVSVLVGLGYYSYLKAVPFPSDWVRIVPLLWLIGAVSGAVWAVKSLRASTFRILAAVLLALAVPNILLALIFSLAAAMGD